MVTLTCSKWIELPRSSAARSNCCMDAILDKGWCVARMKRSAIRETFARRALSRISLRFIRATIVLLRQILQQQIQRGLGKRLHIGLPVRAARFQCEHFVLWPRHRHAAMPGGVAVTVAGRPRCARLRQSPVRRKTPADL